MSLINGRQDEDYNNNDDNGTSRSVDDCGEIIPSQLRGSVVVNVTSEDILLYIIIVFFIVPLSEMFFLRSICHYYFFH